MPKKEKTKAELLEEINRLQKANAELTNNYRNLANGNEVGCYTYKFTVTDFTSEYFEDLKKRTVFVSRKVVINTGKNHKFLTFREVRKWPDGNRVVISTTRPLNESIVSKIFNDTTDVVIDFYDYRIDTPLNIALDK